MKKNYLLLSGLIMTSAILSAQQGIEGMSKDPKKMEQSLYSAEKASKFDRSNLKAYGDTLYYEDFDSQIPAGWVSEDRNNLGLVWIWDDGAPGGQFSTNQDTLSSTTASNGYLSLPSDRYNTPLPDPEFLMDAFITSPAIPIQPKQGVLLTFQHSQRYCCSGANELVVEVSADSINWDTLDGTGGRGPNTATPDGEILELDVSATLANEDTAYIRFRSTGNSHYYWMIDDLALIEGPSKALELENYFVKYHPTLEITPIYTRIPFGQVDTAFFSGFLRNAGYNDQTNATFEVTVTHDSTATGGPGNGLDWSNSAAYTSPLPGFARDTTTIMDPYFAEDMGFYTVDYTLTSDSINQIAASRYTSSSVFAVTDTVFALDNGSFNGVTGPSDYIAAGLDNDLALMLFVVQEEISVRSVSGFIRDRTDANDNSRVVGVQISPRVFGFDETQATIEEAINATEPVATNPFSYTVTQGDIDTWVTLNFLEPVNLEPGAYYVGFEQTGGGNTDKAMVFGRDRLAEETAPAFSMLYFLNSSEGGWLSIGGTRMAGIRMNIGDTIVPDTTSISEYDVNNSNFIVSPNPSDGVFKVEFTDDNMSGDTYVLNVRNMLGQTVYSENVTANGSRLNKYLDLKGYEKGVYFVSLESDDTKLLRKVIVK